MSASRLAYYYEQELAKLDKQLEEVQKDAERYRRLRTLGWNWSQREELDAAVDYAMANPKVTA